VWCYVLCGFLVQDLLVKRSVYKAYDWYAKDVSTASATEQLHTVISNQIEEERLTMRRTSMTQNRKSSLNSSTSDADGGAGGKGGGGGAGNTSFRSSNRSVSFGNMFQSRSERESALEAKLDMLEKELRAVKDILKNKKDKKL